MTQKTKLEPIGPYTPEHDGPHAHLIEGFLEPKLCKVLFSKSGVALVETEDYKAPYALDTSNIRNAREVPVAREFWAVEYMSGLIELYSSKDRAVSEERAKSYVRTIHVREVLPGESA